MVDLSVRTVSCLFCGALEMVEIHEIWDHELMLHTWPEPDAGDAAALSATASLVANLFGHSDEKVEKDLRRMLKNKKSK